MPVQSRCGGFDAKKKHFFLYYVLCRVRFLFVRRSNRPTTQPVGVKCFHAQAERGLRWSDAGPRNETILEGDGSKKRLVWAAQQSRGLEKDKGGP